MMKTTIPNKRYIAPPMQLRIKPTFIFDPIVFQNFRLICVLNNDIL